MKFLIINLFLLLSFLGCEVDKSSSSTLITPVNSNGIKIFTLAPVLNAVVRDAANQVAIYNEGTQQYRFKNSISYPITASTTTQTYIDVDYDNNKTANDLNVNNYFIQKGLKSFCNEINYLTALYYEQNLSASGITTDQYISDIQNRYGINICSDAMKNEESAKVLFAAYDYVVSEGNLTNLSDIENKLTLVDDFFTLELTNIIDKIEYYSAYDALIRLDNSQASRVDTIHKPEISTTLRAKLTLVNQNSTAIDVFDILHFNNFTYLAAGQDELASTDKDLANQKFSSDVSLLSFGRRLDSHSFGADDCLFLANSFVGLTSFKIDGLGFTKEANITSYSNDVNISKFSNASVTNSNSYVSKNSNKRLLGISTSDKGYYLINIKESFNGCKPILKDINSTRDFIIQEQNGSVVDATFRDDGTYLYVSHKEDGVYGYKTDILDRDETMNSRKKFILENNETAYNLKLFNNDNELFITTNRGVLIYDIGSSSQNIKFVSEYRSEGAQTDYYPYIDSYQDYIFFSDGYKGIKVLKMDNSFHPMLCGVEYFAPRNNSYELAKTTSVKYDNGELYVGISSYGVVKFKLDDILFKHCK